jgi:hypothetical protein
MSATEDRYKNCKVAPSEKTTWQVSHRAKLYRKPNRLTGPDRYRIFHNHFEHHSDAVEHYQYLRGRNEVQWVELWRVKSECVMQWLSEDTGHVE